MRTILWIERVVFDLTNMVCLKVNATGWFPLRSRPVLLLRFTFALRESYVHNEKSNKMQKCIESFYYYIFLWSSTCFGRHTAHYQEPKTALAASVCV
jgi:hypothetical protein